MKIIMHPRLNIRRTYPRIRHNRRTTTRFHCRCRIPIATIVLRMIRPKLMPQFMRNIIHIKRVAYWSRTTRNPPCLLTISANTSQTRQTPTIRTKNMTHIVIRHPNQTIHHHLIFIYHRTRSTIGERVSSRIGEN